MQKFLTIATGLPKPVLLWEETQHGLPKILGHYKTVNEVPDGSDLEVWTHTVPTTAQTGIPVNPGKHSVVDADGAPLWDGARISFRVPTYYVNSEAGKGVFQKADQYGGTNFVSDTPMNVHGRGGSIVDCRREQYTSLTNWAPSSHKLAGCRILANKLGDPFEHGQTEMFMRLDEDPRNSCEIQHKPVPARAGP